jgi:hypothetical protein
MAHGKSCLTRGFHCCPNFFFLISFARPASLYCEECMCVCVCVCVCVYIYVYICVYIYIAVHISDCVEIVYELPLLPNNTANETFSQKSGALRGVDLMLINGVPTWRRLSEYLTYV